MDQHKVDFELLGWQTPLTGLRFKAAAQGSRRLRLAEYSKEMEPHWCEKGHIGYVLDGRLEIRFDDSVVEFGAGDGILLPAGRVHRHMARALSDVVTVVFVEDL
jgi:ethanolamine utilization protein EutQ (cupin superfamily)